MHLTTKAPGCQQPCRCSNTWDMGSSQAPWSTYHASSPCSSSMCILRDGISDPCHGMSKARMKSRVIVMAYIKVRPTKTTTRTE